VVPALECERCGKVVMRNEIHAARWRVRTLADILRRMPTTAAAGEQARPTC
jgi:hypothetical protein